MPSYYYMVPATMTHRPAVDYTQAGVLTHKVCSSSNLNQLHHGITECASPSW